MESKADQVIDVIRSFMKRMKPDRPVEVGTSLFADGLGLDSLETAELSALLEDKLGSDPFSSGQMPDTVGDIVAFYGSAAP